MSDSFERLKFQKDAIINKEYGRIRQEAISEMNQPQSPATCKLGHPRWAFSPRFQEELGSPIMDGGCSTCAAIAQAVEAQEKADGHDVSVGERPSTPTPPPWKPGQMLIHPGTHQIIKIEAVGLLLTYRYWQMDTWASMVSQAYQSDFTLWKPYPRVGDWVRDTKRDVIYQVDVICKDNGYVYGWNPVTREIYNVPPADLEPASPPVVEDNSTKEKEWNPLF